MEEEEKGDSKERMKSFKEAMAKSYATNDGRNREFDRTIVKMLARNASGGDKGIDGKSRSCFGGGLFPQAFKNCTISSSPPNIYRFGPGSTLHCRETASARGVVGLLPLCALYNKQTPSLSPARGTTAS